MDWFGGGSCLAPLLGVYRTYTCFIFAFPTASSSRVCCLLMMIVVLGWLVRAVCMLLLLLMTVGLLMEPSALSWGLQSCAEQLD